MYQYEQRGMGVSVRTENDGCIGTNREGWVYQYEQRMVDGEGGVNRDCLVRVKRERLRNRQWVRWKQTGREMETDREGDGNRQGGRWETDREGDGNRRRVALSLRCTKGNHRNNHSGVVLSRLSFARVDLETIV